MTGLIVRRPTLVFDGVVSRTAVAKHPLGPAGGQW